MSPLLVFFVGSQRLLHPPILPCLNRKSYFWSLAVGVLRHHVNRGPHAETRLEFINLDTSKGDAGLEEKHGIPRLDLVRRTHMVLPLFRYSSWSASWANPSLQAS